MKRALVLSVAALILFGTAYAAEAACTPSLLGQVRYGQNGQTVWAAQECLIAAGFTIPAGATGYYGNQTRLAVASFYAKILGLASWDGRSIGPKGREALRQQAASQSGNASSNGSNQMPGYRRGLTDAELAMYVKSSREIGAGSFSAGRGLEGTVPQAPMDKAAAGAPGSPAVRASNTNVQVAGIDEPDIVKTDGSHLFISTESAWRPWVIGGPMMAPSVGMPAILPREEEMGKTYAVSAFPLSNLGISSDSISEKGEMLFVKETNTLVIFAHPNAVAYDVSNPKQPKKVWTHTYGENTSLVTARLLNQTVYLVTSTRINDMRPCPVSPIGGTVISCGDVWVPRTIEPSDTTYSFIALSPKTGSILRSVSFVGDSSNAVVSVFPEAAYVAYRSMSKQADFAVLFAMQKLDDLLPAALREKIAKVAAYDISSQAKLVEIERVVSAHRQSLSNDERLRFDTELSNRLMAFREERAREMDTTVITKIPLATFELSAVGTVPGHLVNQFALDEYNGTLRVATTIGESWNMGAGKTKNDVYVLDSGLAILGSVRDLGISERIYSVRFIGDRGYVVTFRQTDPFYVIDLSVPTAPKLAGELKIPGYSAYLEPLSSTRILGVGREEGTVKLSVFDVSNPNLPIEKAKYILNEGWTDVEANHRAFLKDEKYQVFFIPAGQGGYVFSYDNDSLTLKTAVSGYNVKRAVYISDLLYIVGKDKVTVLDEQNWKKVGELELK